MIRDLLWCLETAASVAAPFVFGFLVVGIAELAKRAVRRSRNLVRSVRYEQELLRVIRARNEAVGNIVELQQQARRRLDELMRQRGLAGATDWRRP